MTSALVLLDSLSSRKQVYICTELLSAKAKRKESNAGSGLASFVSKRAKRDHKVKLKEGCVRHIGPRRFTCCLHVISTIKVPHRLRIYVIEIPLLS